MTEEITALKEEGNTHFRAGEYEQARDSYTEAIFQSETSETEVDSQLKAALYSNRAGCFMYLEDAEKCLADADHALALMTPYPRVRMRRVWALRKLNRFNDALTEIKKAIEEDPNIQTTHSKEYAEVQREAAEETEKMKTEALGQLKNLGNKFLGLFGMSTDNFQLNQNPDGGYNIQMKQ